jgi:hypothetical protein
VAACGGQSMSATSAIASAALWASAINSLITARAASRNWIRYYNIGGPLSQTRTGR